jgi:prepilin-type processing-associated H-X9-DG protein
LANFNKYNPWAYFKKRVNVPQNVVVALDVTTALWNKNDDRFEDLDDLTTSNGAPPGASRPYPRGGTVHKGKANVLFADGSVRLVLAYNPKNPTNAPALGEVSQLEDWMIKAPNRIPVAADAPKRWQNRRELPF